jgi:hypothetical protein
MICIAAGRVIATLAASQITLGWTHSIEKIRWEEDWRLQSGALVLVAARIRGSGAGMEIPDGAVLKEGVWHYRPTLAPLSELRLARSPFGADGADYTLCVKGACHPLADWLPGIDNATDAVVRPCPQ